MRIITGNFKGKKILQPKDKTTRPLKDLTKESIFNIILHSKKFKVLLENSNILDLFSGSGSFGLECLSRGSKKVIFVENYKEILPILKKNISSMHYEDSTSIIERDIFSQLNFETFRVKFDIIFLDPPYKKKEISLLLLKISESNILDKNGIIIIHRQKKEDDDLPNDFRILEEKTYGISRVFFGNFI
tara:strand:- start:3214 stop:3777 length:564 start_codon:yes stop_codon:yes gene_type:complete